LRTTRRKSKRKFRKGEPQKEREREGKCAAVLRSCAGERRRRCHPLPKETASSAAARPTSPSTRLAFLRTPARKRNPPPPPDALPMATPRKPIKLTLPSHETTIGKFLYALRSPSSLASFSFSVG
jgi:hypothetical protein